MIRKGGKKEQETGAIKAEGSRKQVQSRAVSRRPESEALLLRGGAGLF